MSLTPGGVGLEVRDNVPKTIFFKSFPFIQILFLNQESGYKLGDLMLNINSDQAQQAMNSKPG